MSMVTRGCDGVGLGGLVAAISLVAPALSCAHDWDPYLPAEQHPSVAVCGDGVLGDGEVCDDGNTTPSNDAGDFCAEDCRTQSWPCGSWPGYVAEASEAVGIRLTETAVAASSTPYVVVLAGATFSVSGHYVLDAEASGCPSCYVQLYWGLFAGEPPAANTDPMAGHSQQCVVHAAKNAVTPYSFDLTAPAQVGTYFLRWDLTQDFSCIGMADEGTERSLAAICVQ
jgi:cysteine-rich repeat protein